MPQSKFAYGPEYRLHFHWEYRNFFQGSDVLRLRECTVFRIANTYSRPRLGITIKCKCNSVERNRTKRTIREFFRHSKERLGSYDYNVVISGPRKLDFEYARRLRKSLEEGFAGDPEMHRFKRAR